MFILSRLIHSDEVLWSSKACRFSFLKKKLGGNPDNNLNCFGGA
jgi:hypothetical protein